MIHFSEDDRLNPSHVSLYMALFQLWNLNKFNNPISIARGEMKKLSKIGSNNTYLKCLKDLTNYGYLKYIPSHNPYKGSEVYLCKFDTSTTQALRHKYLKIDTSTEQALRPSINSINYNKQNIEKEDEFKPPTLDDLKIFFKKKKDEKKLKIEPSIEAQKFYNHYKANGWMIGKNKMQDWKAAAENWILKTIEFNGTHQQNHNSTTNHLHTNQNKDYGEPL